MQHFFAIKIIQKSYESVKINQSESQIKANIIPANICFKLEKVSISDALPIEAAHRASRARPIRHQPANSAVPQPPQTYLSALEVCSYDEALYKSTFPVYLVYNAPT